MKKNKKNESRRGVVLLQVLILLLLACIAVGRFLTYSSASFSITRKMLDSEKAFVVADAGIQQATLLLRDVLKSYGLSSTLKNEIDVWLDYYVNNYASKLVPPDENFEYVAFGARRVDDFPTSEKTIAYGPSSGNGGLAQRFEVICAARKIGSDVCTVLMQQMQIISSSVVQYGVFYDDDLEAQPGGNMSFEGKVHSNGDIFVGGSLTFKKGITAVGGIYNVRKNTLRRYDKNVNIQGYTDHTDADGNSSRTYGSTVNTYDGTLRKYIESPIREGYNDYLKNSALMDGQGYSTNWKNEATKRWGDAMKTGLHGVSRLAPPIDAGDTPHAIIERPKVPGDDGYSAKTEEQKFANRANVTIHVTYQKDANGNYLVDESGYPVPSVHAYNYDGVEFEAGLSQATLQKESATSSRDKKNSTNGDYYMASEGEYQLSNRFTDWRERDANGKNGAVMQPLDIYLDRFLENEAIRNALYDASNTGENEEGQRETGIIFLTVDPEPVITTYSTNFTNQTVSEQYWNENKPIYENVTVQYKDNKGRWRTRIEQRIVGYGGWDTRYVNQTVTNVTTHVTEPGRECVRIRNASDLPEDASSSGLSIITDLPMYVDGCFNTCGTQNGGTQTAALLAGDAVTILSTAWQDSKSRDNMSSSRIASHARINGVVMTGNTTTSPGVSYNGGLENVFRMLENWRGKTLYFGGSIICMWASEIATGPWGSDNVYDLPTRRWEYDNLYLTKTPPGIPRLITVEETLWKKLTKEDLDSSKYSSLKLDNY